MGRNTIYIHISIINIIYYVWKHSQQPPPLDNRHITIHTYIHIYSEHKPNQNDRRSSHETTSGLTITKINRCVQYAMTKKFDTPNPQFASRGHPSSNHRMREHKCDMWVISHISVGRVCLPHCLVVFTNTNKKQWTQTQPKWQKICPQTMISYADNRKVDILFNSMSLDVLNATDI